MQRVGIDLSGIPTITGYWVWCESPGEFIPYSTDASIVIELAYQSNASSIDLSQYTDLRYTIDIINCKQISQLFNTQRDIHRIPTPGTLQSLLEVCIPTTFSVGTMPSTKASGATTLPLPPPSASAALPSHQPLAAFSSGQATSHTGNASSRAASRSGHSASVSNASTSGKTASGSGQASSGLAANHNSASSSSNTSSQNASRSARHQAAGHTSAQTTFAFGHASSRTGLASTASSGHQTSASASGRSHGQAGATPTASQATASACHSNVDNNMLESYDAMDDILCLYADNSKVPAAPNSVVVKKSTLGGFFRRPIGDTLSTFFHRFRYPLGWKSHPNSEECITVALDPRTDSEYRRVEAKFKESLPTFPVLSIKRVQNRWLWVRYTQAKSQLQKKNGGAVNELELFHGSKTTPSDNICASEEGFDMRFSQRCLWGQANYFAVKAFYSHHYARTVSDDGLVKEVILAKVLTGDSIECEPDSTLRFPPEKRLNRSKVNLKQVRYDSVRGTTQGYTVYMTYSNDRAYPAYIITYRAR